VLIWLVDGHRGHRGHRGLGHGSVTSHWIGLEMFGLLLQEREYIFFQIPSQMGQKLLNPWNATGFRF